MSYGNNALAALVGRRIDAIILSANNEEIEFVCPTERLRFYAFGDCCSESWFNHFAGVGALIGQTVKAVIERPEYEEEGTRDVCDTVYGHLIVTDLGSADLELRNSSNGYYGGRVAPYPDAPPLTGRFVTEDF